MVSFRMGQEIVFWDTNNVLCPNMSNGNTSQKVSYAVQICVITKLYLNEKVNLYILYMQM